MAKQDFYDILGVAKTASADEIKSAYRKLARKYHPDATKNDPKLTEKFKLAQEAYEVLSDPAKRKKYDQFGHAGVGAQPGAGGDPFEQFRRAQQSRGGNGRRAWDGAAGGRVDEAGRGRGRAAPQRGQDIEYPVSLTFEQAARGTNLPLQINREGRLETIDVK